jgi:hypothetical protein
MKRVVTLRKSYIQDILGHSVPLNCVATGEHE